MFEYIKRKYTLSKPEITWLCGRFKYKAEYVTKLVKDKEKTVSE